MGLTFVLQGYDNIELKPNGSNEMLSVENMQEYINLTTLFTFTNTIYNQISSFREGFNIV